MPPARSRYLKRKRPSVERVRPEPVSPEHWGAKCGVCPLRGSRPVFGEGPDGAALAVVGEAPGLQEVDAGLPFVGRSGEYVEERLALHKLTRRDVLLENACLCFPPGGDMRAFLQRAKKDFKADLSERGIKGKAAPEFQSPIDCCRPRLMFALGVSRCGACLKWDLPGPGISDDIACRCKTPRWVKSKFAPVKAVLATGNAALAALTGEDGIKAKMNYVFGK